MRKQKQAAEFPIPAAKNPVAKFAHQFNKARVYADKRKYQRKAKHSGLEPFAIVSGDNCKWLDRVKPSNRRGELIRPTSLTA